ncbi:phosphoribosylglycinamide formyltransferase [Pararobbsia alpina]|uniref:Phosphoribosylglycinamide formyltransferase n=1 Tax=Pararobbsia alpina TaxID=621374 RepID=A0A6S7ASP3_9BURK|nr:phosphoribosylglycinamide formyltransferase [Pararobbsia alpina]CAB3776538.1 Phosphoribosylglycinamide formyltransferase [Pararobbsia alpina]
MKNIVILISGRGSNMEAIVAAQAAERWPARIAAVVSSRPEADGLAFAQSHGIPTAVVDHREYPDREQFDTVLRQTIDGFAPDLVVLAGFMRVLTPAFVAHYAQRMVNVHPSLLPSFPGLKTHQRALEAGVKLHGATIHFVTADLDLGPIVLQGVVPVKAGDDPETLRQRVLAVEHQIYPRAVRWFVEDRLSVAGGLASLTPPEPQWWFATEQA